jgi:hypothetical protein
VFRGALWALWSEPGLLDACSLVAPCGHGWPFIPSSCRPPVLGLTGPRGTPDHRLRCARSATLTRPSAAAPTAVLLTVALRAPPSGRGLATLRGVDEALAELADYFRRWCEPPDAELVRLAAAARAAGCRWEVIAAACDARDHPDPAAVVYRPFGLIPGQGAGPLFRVTQHAVQKLIGGEGGYYLPLTWPCPGCGRQVTDRAAYGRPVHVEHGHAPGCARLARDQAADDARRRDRLPGQILHSEDRPARCNGTGWPSGSSMTARGAADTATSITTLPPLTGTGPLRSVTTATPTCIRASRSR